MDPQIIVTDDIIARRQQSVSAKIPIIPSKFGVLIFLGYKEGPAICVLESCAFGSPIFIIYLFFDQESLGPTFIY
jgi:hypothetical protein